LQLLLIFLQLALPSGTDQRGRVPLAKRTRENGYEIFLLINFRYGFKEAELDRDIEYETPRWCKLSNYLA
jgi:hypothetical protein